MGELEKQSSPSKSNSPPKTDGKSVSNSLPLESEYDFNEHLIEAILPAREIHLVAGPSGGGKTSWLLKMIEAWAAGNAIFGHKSNPKPYLYVSADRSGDSVKRTMMRLGVVGCNVAKSEKCSDKHIPYYSPKTESERKANLQTIVLGALRTRPETRVFFIEGFGSKVPQGKIGDYNIVSNWLLSLGALCYKHNITIIGVVHSPKVKENEQYLNPRQRALGSVAWAAFTETIFLVEPVDPDDATNTLRRFMLLPRNAKEETFNMEFKDGMLKPATEDSAAHKTKIDNFIDALDIDETFAAFEFIEDTGVSRQTASRYLQKLVNKRLISATKKGTYRKLDASKRKSEPANPLD